LAALGPRASAAGNDEDVDAAGTGLLKNRRTTGCYDREQSAGPDDRRQGMGQKPEIVGPPPALSQRLRLRGVFPARASRRAASARSSSVNSPAHLGCPIACSTFIG
jgi:hypothetical protein